MYVTCHELISVVILYKWFIVAILGLIVLIVNVVFTNSISNTVLLKLPWNCYDAIQLSIGAEQWGNLFVSHLHDDVIRVSSAQETNVLTLTCSSPHTYPWPSKEANLWNFQPKFFKFIKHILGRAHMPRKIQRFIFFLADKLNQQETFRVGPEKCQNDWIFI